MNIYEEKSYREIIKKAIEEQKKLNAQINFEKASTAASVAKSYFSKVMHGYANLSDDQLYSICLFLKLSEIERHFVFLLRDFEMTEVPERKKELSLKIDTIRRDQGHSHAKVGDKTVGLSESQLVEYYSDPLFVIVHMALLIPRYKTAPVMLSRDLKIRQERLGEIIAKLERMNLIRRDEKGIEVIEQSIYLPKNSSLSKTSRNLFKVLSIQRQNEISDDDNFYYWLAFTANTEIQKKAKEKLLVTLKEIEAMLTTAKDEDVYYLGIDLFPWTK